MPHNSAMPSGTGRNGTWRRALDVEQANAARRDGIWELTLGVLLGLLTNAIFPLIEPNKTTPGVSGALLFAVLWACWRTQAWRKWRP